MASTCSQQEHDPHVWPELPLTKDHSIMACERVCQWCSSNKQFSSATHLRLHSRRHLKGSSFTVLAKRFCKKAKVSAGGNSDATTSQIATVSDRNEQYDLGCDMKQHTQQAIKIAAETVTKPGGDKDRYLQDKTSGIPPSPTFAKSYSVKDKYLQNQTSGILPSPTFVEGYSVKDWYLRDKTSGILPGPTFADDYSIKDRYLQDKTGGILPDPTFVEGYSVKDSYPRDKTSDILSDPTFVEGYSAKDRYIRDKNGGILPGPTFVEGYSVNRAQQGDTTEELDRDSRIHEDWLDWGD